MKNLALAAAAVAASLLFTGCASVDMASKDESAKAKAFNPPAPGKAGVYIYRDSFVGQTLKKDLWIDGNCIGESANKMFFYTQVAGNQSHKLDTESEFSPNTLEAVLAADKNHFFRQYIKMGAFVGGAAIEPVTEAQGKAALAKLELAKPGKCSDTK